MMIEDSNLKNNVVCPLNESTVFRSNKIAKSKESRINEWNKANKGSITIFFSIILAVVIAFTVLLIDYARIRSAKSISSAMLDVAVNSTLAGYYAELKEDYGLMALYHNNSSDLSDVILEPHPRIRRPKPVCSRL